MSSRKNISNFKKVFTAFAGFPLDVPLEKFGKNKYKTLVSTILSSRTKDEITYSASLKLFRLAPDIDSLYKLDVKTIEKAIYPVGFYRVKARNLKMIAGILSSKFGGIIPGDFKKLTKLPGVGRKTANLVLNRAFGKPAISVDTHVHRISNLLGWVNTKTPDQTENELKKLLPKKYWKDINRLFVSVGRQIKSPKKLKKFIDSLK